MQLNTYLTFDGRCADAFRFYRRCLGGELIAMIPYGETPVRDQVPSESHGKIMHACLVADGQVLMGSDATPACPYEGIKGAQVTLNVDTPDEAEDLFGSLSRNGTVLMPLGETFWATRFAMFVDQFGVPWAINCAKPT